MRDGVGDVSDIGAQREAEARSRDMVPYVFCGIVRDGKGRYIESGQTKCFFLKDIAP